MRQILASVTRRLISLSGTIEGYEQPELVEEIFRKTVAFEPATDWPEMVGVTSVLDFGGGCGKHYKIAKRQTPDVRWAVVETPALVARSSELETDNLRFFSSIDSAKDWLGHVAVMHSDGAVQYTPNPDHTINHLCSVGAMEMQWKRLFLSSGELKRENQLSLLGENGPSGSFTGKAVRYTRSAIAEAAFLHAHRNYSIIDRGDDWFRFSLSRE